MLAILLLAAGASSRMGGTDKLLEKLDGEPLVRRMARHALASGLPLWVALPKAPHPRHGALDDLPLTPVEVADAAMGMAHSIRAGINALPAHCEAVMILPADMPELDTGDLARMQAAWRAAPEGTTLRATGADGRPGHPVIFPACLFPSLAALSGDRGARALLDDPARQLRLVALPGRHALTDLDTPEDWARWRALRRSAEDPRR